jgi:hypothetical protein
MSLLMPLNLRCPHCGTVNNAPVAGSINADRRPDLRQAILENRFQDTVCSKCNTSFRAECDLNLLDVERQQWIVALPASASRKAGAIAFDRPSPPAVGGPGDPPLPNLY